MTQATGFHGVDQARTRLIGKWVLLLCLTSLGETFARVQATGRLSGSVEDAAGRAVSNARVTLTVGNTTVVYAETSSRGRFFFPALRPQAYDLTVEAANFAKQTLQSVEIDDATETSLDPIHLMPGDAKLVTSAKAPAQPLQTASIHVGDVATTGQVNSLPLPGRDPIYLLYTFPGVQENGRAPAAIYGQPLSIMDITYEGISATEGFFRGSSTTLSLHTAEVGEAAVASSPIYGCGCAQASFTAPSGGRALDGSVYWFGTPAGVSAQYFADNSRNAPATTRLNQLGATFGAPLIKNRLHFFVNYESAIDHSTVTRIGATSVRPLISSDPLMQEVLNLIPSNPSGQYRGSQTNGGRANIGLARLDYVFSPRHTFGLTLAGHGGSADDPTDSPVFGAHSAATSHVSSRFIEASWLWSKTPRLTNDFHAGASYLAIDYRNSLRARFGFIADLADPNVSVSQPMAGIDPQGSGERRASMEDIVTKMTARYSWQVGFRLQQYQLSSYGVNNGPLDSLSVPRYVVSNVAQGLITEADQRFNILSPTSGYSAGSTALGKLSATMASTYIQLTRRPFRSLTITAGLRYDFFVPATQETGAAIIPILSGQVLTGQAGDAVYNKQMTFGYASHGHAFYRPDLNNLSGYAGAVWKPSSKLPIVLRGGTSASQIYDELLPALSIFALQNPFQSFNVSAGLSGAPVPLSKAPLISTPVMPALNLASLYSFANSYGQEPGTVYGVDPDYQMTNVRYWNVGVESEWKEFHFDVRYIGNRMEEGLRSADRNLVMISPSFLASFHQVQSALNSGAPTSGFPSMPGGGLCANFNLQNCQPDLYAISLIRTGQVGELGRWFEGQGYNPYGNYDFLGNPLTPQGIDVLSHIATSRYDALQLTLSRRLARGLSLTASYVLSKAMSDLDDYRPGAVDSYLDLDNPSLEWSSSPFNVAHVFKAASTWDLPFSKIRGSVRSLPGRLLSGWSISGIVVAQSGAPFSLLSGGYVTTPDGAVTAITGLGTFTSQADSGQNTVQTSLTAEQIQKDFGIHKNGDGTVTYVNAPAGAFEEPGAAAVGNLQRRMFNGPGAFNLNLGVRKSISLTERTVAEFRAESINVLNNVNWLVGDQTYMGASNQKNTSLFDGNMSQWNTPRSFQFLLRLSF